MYTPLLCTIDQNLIIIHECSKKLLKMKNSKQKLTPSTYRYVQNCIIFHWKSRLWITVKEGFLMEY